MKKNTLFKSLLLSCIITTLFPGLSQAQTNISSNPNGIDDYPVTYANGIAWQGEVDGTRKIFLKLYMSSVQVIPSPAVYDHSPKIHDRSVAWIGFDGNDDEIFFYKDSKTSQLSDNDFPDLNPFIEFDQVAWYGGHDSNSYEIYYYNHTTSTIVQLTHNNYPDMNPKMFHRNLVWQGHDGNDWEIFLYNGVAVTQLTHNDVDDVNPIAEYDEFAWRQFDGSDFEIIHYKNGTITQVTDNLVDDEQPTLSARRLIWTAKDGGDYDIFCKFDGSGIVNITNNNVHDEFIGVRSAHTLWLNYEDTDGEIFFMFAASFPSSQRIHQVTNNNLRELNPTSFGKTFAWSSVNNVTNDQEIYTRILGERVKILINTDPLSMDTTLLPDSTYSLAFEAYGNTLIPGTLYSAQLSTVNSQEFPTTPQVLVTSAANPLQFTIPHDQPVGTYALRIAGAGAFSNIITIHIKNPNDSTDIISRTETSNASKQLTETLGNDMQINVYPNPFSEALNVSVSSPNQEEIQLKLMDHMGEVVSTSTEQTNSLIKLQEHTSPGIYILQVSVNGVIRMFRLNKN